VTATANNGIVANKGFNLQVIASAMGSTAGSGFRGVTNGQQWIVKSADGLPSMVNTGPTMSFSPNTSNQKLVTGILLATLELLQLMVLSLGKQPQLVGH
jgi:hypothetical protein